MASGQIQREFEEFVRQVYPNPPAAGSAQYRQLRDAFFGGCLIGFTSTDGLALAIELRDYGYGAASSRPARRAAN